MLEGNSELLLLIGKMVVVSVLIIALVAALIVCLGAENWFSLVALAGAVIDVFIIRRIVGQVSHPWIRAAALMLPSIYIFFQWGHSMFDALEYEEDRPPNRLLRVIIACVVCAAILVVPARRIL